MKPPVETIRISSLGRDQLIKLKRNTDIENWNILCRWAFCVSIRESSTPPQLSLHGENGVEMTWKVFSGEWSNIFSSLLLLRAKADGMIDEPDGISTCLRLHLHRGLGYLSSGKERPDLASFLTRWSSES